MVTNKKEKEPLTSIPLPFRNQNHYPLNRIRTGIIVTISGFLIFLIGARPDALGFDRSPVIGYIQIAVMLIGIAIFTSGGYYTLNSLWHERKHSIAAEIGARFISTGYVVIAISAMADFIGLGSHPFPIMTPFFGIWQARGVLLGESFIAIGFLMMLPYSRSPLFNGTHNDIVPTVRHN